MLPDTPLNDQRNLPFTGLPRPPTNKDGVEPLDGVPVLPASRRFTKLSVAGS